MARYCELRTWSGQAAENAWHWNLDTYKRLGNICFLISSGTTKSRSKAYTQYIDLKRWFLESEFEEYISKLDIWRVDHGFKPLRGIIGEIYKERTPETGWQALDGEWCYHIMPDMNEVIPVEDQAPNGIPIIPSEVERVVQPVTEKVEPRKVVKVEYVEQMALDLF